MIFQYRFFISEQVAPEVKLNMGSLEPVWQIKAMAYRVLQQAHCGLAQIIYFVDAAAWSSHWLKDDAAEVLRQLTLHHGFWLDAMNWLFRQIHIVFSWFLWNNRIFDQRLHWNWGLRSAFANAAVPVAKLESCSVCKFLFAWSLKGRPLILLLIDQVYFEVWRWVVTIARLLFCKSLDWLYCLHMVCLDQAVSQALSAVHRIKLLSRLHVWLLPVLQIFFHRLLGGRWFKLTFGELFQYWWNDALFWSWNNLLMVVNLGNRIHCLISVIIFIELVSLLSSPFLRILNRLPWCALFFHVFHYFPYVVFIILLNIKLGSIVVVDIIS